MNPLISDSIDPNKISEALGVNWLHQIIQDDCFDKPELITLENTYLFDLLDHHSLKIRLCVISDLTKEVQILFDFMGISRSIRFQNISRILYNPKLKLVIFESRDFDSYSQLRVERDGKFDLSISNPISNYQNSWLTFMGESLGLLEFTPE